MRARYIDHAARLACPVAIDATGVLVGFQIAETRLGRATPMTCPAGWGIIGTHISPDAARRGVGRALVCREPGRGRRRPGWSVIDATIGAANADGLAYYAAMGFRDLARTGRCRSANATISTAGLPPADVLA